MLNRRILRIKAFKLVYSKVVNPSLSVEEALDALTESCESTRDLYLRMLAIAAPLAGEARERLEAARSKFNPSPEELHPNMKFASNLISSSLEEDPDFQKIIKKKKISWENDDAYLRKLYESVRGKDYFREYMESPESGIAQDAALFVKIYEQEFSLQPDLQEILEDLSIFWNDELEYALSWCCRSIEALGRGERWSLPELYLSEMSPAPGRQSDKAFVRAIVRTAINGFEKYRDRVYAATPKWDEGRICATDLALIICGLAEADCRQEGVEYRTIINEYVEISKYYSTPDSRAFVNGVLDNLIDKKQ